MKISLGSDHAGYKLKGSIIEHLNKRKILDGKTIECIDYGTTVSKERVDYPDYVSQAAEAVVKGDAEMSIVVCGSGIGASIVANKINGIRAALCTTEELAILSREHNNANVLALGERVVDKELALKIVDKWLITKFKGGRHKIRIDKISKLENRQKSE